MKKLIIILLLLPSFAYATPLSDWIASMGFLGESSSWTGAQSFLSSTTLQSFTSTNSTTTSATSTNKYVSNRFSVGSTTTNSLAQEVIGPLTANGSTTIQMGKIQWDGYTSAGSRRCFFFQAAGTLVSSPGACK